MAFPNVAPTTREAVGITGKTHSQKEIPLFPTRLFYGNEFKVQPTETKAIFLLLQSKLSRVGKIKCLEQGYHASGLPVRL